MMTRRNKNSSKIETSNIGMEHNFHEINAYHSFDTKFMFLTDDVTNDIITKSNKNDDFFPSITK